MEIPSKNLTELNSVAISAYALEHFGERKKRQHDCDDDSHRGGHRDMVSPFWINKGRRRGPYSQQVTSKHTGFRLNTQPALYDLGSATCPLYSSPRYSRIHHNSNCMFKSSACILLKTLSNLWELQGFELEQLSPPSSHLQEEWFEVTELPRQSQISPHYPGSRDLTACPVPLSKPLCLTSLTFLKST